MRDILRELGLVRTRVDFEQLIARLDHLAFREVDLHELSVHPALNRVDIQRGDRAQPDQIDADITLGRRRGHDANLVAAGSLAMLPGLGGGIRGLGFRLKIEKVDANTDGREQDKSEHKPKSPPGAALPGLSGQVSRSPGRAVRMRRNRRRPGRLLLKNFFRHRVVYSKKPEETIRAGTSLLLPLIGRILIGKQHAA